MSSLTMTQWAQWAQPLFSLLGLVIALTLIEALSRPLFMCRSPATQARYTTAFVLVLMTIAFLQWHRVSVLVASHEIWSKQFYRDFSAWALRLWVALFLTNVARFFFPLAVPLVFPLVLPLPAVGPLQGAVLALDKEQDFWSCEKNPCFGISWRSLHRDRHVKIERTTPGMEDEVKSESVKSESVESESVKSEGERASPGLEDFPVFQPPEYEHAHRGSDSDRTHHSSPVSTPSPSPRSTPRSTPRSKGAPVVAPHNRR